MSPFYSIGQYMPIVIVVGAVLFLAMRGGRRGAIGATLVLRRFHYEFNPTDGVYVDIAGRPSGLLGWILTTVGWDQETRLRVTPKDIAHVSAGLAGRSRTAVPMSHVACTSCGFAKSLPMLLLGCTGVVLALLILISNGGAAPMMAMLVLGGLFLFGYWLSSRFYITIQPSGGAAIGVTFKRSVIENVAVDFDRAAEVVQIINDLVLGRKPQGPSESAPVHAGPARSPAPAGSTHVERPVSREAPPSAVSQGSPKPRVGRACPKCSAVVEEGSAFCENCGSRL